MLSLFRQNNIFAAAALFLFTIVIRLSPFFSPIHVDLNINAPLAQFIFNRVQNFDSYYFFSIIAASLLVFIQAWLINYITSEHGILYNDSFLPGLIFVTLNSLYPDQMLLTPQLLANTFIILLFQRLCRLYESEKPLYIVLDSGLYLGLASMFNYDLLVYLPFILISVIVMTSFNLRYLAVAVLGILIPIYFTAIIFFLRDNFNELLLMLEKSFNRQYVPNLKINFSQVFPWLILAPIVLFSTINMQLKYFKNRVKTRRILLDIGLMFLFSLLVVSIEDRNFIFAVTYLSVPLSIVVAYYFLSPKHLILKEIFYLLLVASAIYYQYFTPLFS